MKRPRISRRAAKRLRWQIEDNRCPDRPGITHRRVVVGWTEPFDYTRGRDDMVSIVECSKCGAP